MKKLVSLITVFVLLSIILKAQNSDSEYKTYNLPVFTGIEAGDLANVVISNGSQQSVKVEKDNDGEASLEVKDNILKISSGTMTNFSNVKIIIVCTDLKYIKASGVSKIKSSNTIKSNELKIKAMGASKIDLDIDVQSLTTDISGAAKLVLKGNAIQHISEISGASNLNAKELDVVKMDVQGSGVAKANVNVKTELSGELSGVSSVKYDQKPIIDNLGDNDVKTAKKNRVNTSADDTTKVSLLGSNIEVIDGKETKISIGNTEMIVGDDGKVKIEKKDKNKPYVHHFKGHWSGFELGFNGYVNKDFGTALPAKYDFLKLNDVKSIGVNLNVFELNANIINNRFGVVSGIGLQWNNYRFDDNVVLVPDSSTIYGYHNTAINSYIKSKLVESWVRVPLFLEYQTAKKRSKQFYIAVGGVFAYKIGSHSKQVNFEGGDRNKPKVYNDFYLNPIKLDAEVRVGWGPVKLFASYSLTQMFKENKGPELYPYTVGVTLVSW
ncbi:MAG: DUF2807 domain-containing protein [Bacteroidetes bacterium]|nr:DUF2807 domain-containing protein [Bacteroidota bacterium]